MKLNTFLVPTIIFIIFMGFSSYAEDVSFYGDISSYFLKREFNDSNPVSVNYDKDKDQIASLASNLYLSIADDFMGSFFLDTSLNGDLTNITVNGEKVISPISISVRQVYYQIMPNGKFAFIAGKKLKSLGYSQYFNVSNKLTPEAFKGANERLSGIGYAELNLYIVPSVSLEALLYFPEESEWDQSSIALGAKFQSGLINVDVYGYLDSLKEPSLGYNLAFQQNLIKFYFEGLFAKRMQQDTLKINSLGGGAFTRKSALSLQHVTGVSLFTNYVTYSAEYMYRTDGPDHSDREILLSWIDALPVVDRQSAIKSCYLENRFDTHYFALNSSITKLFPSVTDLFRLDVTALCSAGKEFADWPATVGFTEQIALTAVHPSGNSNATLWIQSYSGGNTSEYRVFPDIKWYAGLIFTYNFSIR